MANIHRGVMSAEERVRSFDLLAISLLLQPYRTHPVFVTARKALVQLSRSSPSEREDYLLSLDHRVRERDGVFATLDDVYMPTFFPPSTYVASLFA